MAENPFRGAFAFRREDAHLFFGRDREAWELEDLAVARRAVLLYSPSGAGKSSLLEARLKPALARLPGGVVVPPTVRLGCLPEPGTSPANPLVASVLASLGVAAAGEVTLGKGLEELVPKDPNGRRPPCFLVFDQFEELFTATFGHPELREDFLGQLAEAFDGHPWLSAVFALREDYLPQLDALRHLLPDGLRARLRLGFLDRQAAREAICGPLRTLDSPIDLPIDILLDELSRSTVVAPDGGHQELREGPIEPVYLQVVCWRLAADYLENRRAYPPALAGEAMRDLLAEAGGISATVGAALSAYYLAAVEEAARASGVAEERLRAFCAGALITGKKTRTLVPHGDGETEGLPQRAIDELVKRYLVRREERRGLFWYELAHDRMIGPVLASQSELEARAALWNRQERPDDLLWRWKKLKAHLPFIRLLSTVLSCAAEACKRRLRRRQGFRELGRTAARGGEGWRRILEWLAAVRRKGIHRVQSRLWPRCSDSERDFLWASTLRLRWRALVALAFLVAICLVAFHQKVNFIFRRVWVPFLDYPLVEIEREILDPLSPPALDRGLRLALLHHDFTRSTAYRRVNPAQCKAIEQSRKLLRSLLAHGPAPPPPPDATDAELRRRACEAAGGDISLAELKKDFDGRRPYRALAYTPCRWNPKVEGTRPPWVRRIRRWNDALDRRFPDDAGCPSPYDPVFRGNPGARVARPPDAAAPRASRPGDVPQPPPPG